MSGVSIVQAKEATLFALSRLEPGEPLQRDRVQLAHAHAVPRADAGRRAHARHRARLRRRAEADGGTEMKAR
jgi:hypothetical protein